MIQWFKSSYSGGDNDCVEVAHLPADYHKPGYSQVGAGSIEVVEGSVSGIRDTKRRDLGALFFGPDEWQAFIGTAKDDLR